MRPPTSTTPASTRRRSAGVRAGWLRVAHLALVAMVGLFACTPAVPPPEAAKVAIAPAIAAPAEVVDVPDPLPEPSEIVPVTSSEPAWGEPLAPVTWVIWGDYECPFTAKLFLRLGVFRKAYPTKRLRVVWRHNPLPFHKNAELYAVAAETVRRLGGDTAFWLFSLAMFENQKGMQPEDIVRFAREAGVDEVAFADAVLSGSYAGKVDEDKALAKKLVATGTPASFINGVFLGGAAADEKLKALIDAELEATRELLAGGVPRERIYAASVEKNYKKREPPKSPPPDTTTVWKVAVGSSPVRGNAGAHVTMVMFGDFQCPFCAKVHSTVTALEKEYGEKLRLVFKHNPLPFHPRAEPVAQFAADVRAQGGDAKFWQAYDLLYADVKALSDQDLEGHAKTLGVQWKRASAAMASQKHAATIEADLDLADELDATGTPHFFINGRRLVGNQPITMFKSIIDEEIAKADKLLASGTPAKKLYETLQKDGRGPPVPVRVVVPAATSANPAKGAKAGAKVVTVQMFADFQCPYCKRVAPTMDELIAAFPGKVRVVWRHRPLPMHKDAQLASEAAVEAFKQKGDAGFWAYSKLLWEDQRALDKEGLIQKAVEAGLDEKKMSAALEARTHQAAVQADNDLAEKLQLSGTPVFAVGDYYVSGAQSLRKFKRAVQLALGPPSPPRPEDIHPVKKANP